MEGTILIYMYQTTVCTGVLWLFYHVFLRLKVGYDISRAYLLAAGFFSLLLPLLRIPVFPGEIVVLRDIPTTATVSFSESVAPVKELALSDFLAWMYIAVAGVIFLRVFSQFYRIYRLKQRGNKQYFSGFTLVRSANITTSFSFFDSVFVGNNQGDTGNIEPIIRHEQSHIRHRHSVDRVLFEFMSIMMWYNPFIYLLKKNIIEIHEYQADRDVLASGVDMSDYRMLILYQVAGCYPEIVSNLNQSFIKKRFIMMTKFPGSKYGLLRIMAVVPVAAGLMLLFSFTKKETVYVRGSDSVQTERDTMQYRVVKVLDRETEDTYLKESIVSDMQDPSSKKMTVTYYKADSEPVKAAITYASFVTDAGEPDDNSLSLSRTVTDGKHISTTGIVKVAAPMSLTRSEIVADSVVVIGIKGTNLTDSVVVVGYGKEAHKVAVTGVCVEEVVVPGNSDTVRGRIDSKSNVRMPLIMIDGKESSTTVLSSMNPQNIASISVMKEDAAEKSGFPDSNGVIIVKTKPSSTLVDSSQIPSVTLSVRGDQNALVLIDGKKASSDALSAMDPAEIHSVTVLKGKAAEDVMKNRGESADDVEGVILVTTKKAYEKSENKNTRRSKNED